MNVQQIIEKCRKFHIPAVMCYIDCSTAFDYVKWNKLYGVLKETGVLLRIVDIVSSYMKVT